MKFKEITDYYKKEFKKDIIKKYIGTGFSQYLIAYQKEQSLRGNLVLIISPNKILQNEILRQDSSVKIEVAHKIMVKGFIETPHEVVIDGENHSTERLINYIKLNYPEVKIKQVICHTIDKDFMIKNKLF